MAHLRRRRLKPLPQERPGSGINSWREVVRTFLRRRSVFAGAAGWPGDWTTIRGEPRCARCGTTKFEAPEKDGETIPACEPCQRVVDLVVTEAA